MKRVELEVKEPGDVVLPAELAKCGLTIEEIGVVFTLFAAATGEINMEEAKEISNPRIQEISKDLQDRGILQVFRVDDEACFEIDITKVKPDGGTD